MGGQVGKLKDAEKRLNLKDHVGEGVEDGERHRLERGEGALALLNLRTVLATCLQPSHTCLFA